MSNESELATATSTPSNEHKKEVVSRRGFIEKSLYGVALAGTTVLPAWAMGPGGYGPAGGYARRGGGHVSKATAHYQYHPNGAQRCGVCVHFRAGRCEIVAGQISPDGWCRYFRGARAPSGSAGGSRY